MKYFIVIVIIFVLLFLYQKKNGPKYKQEKLEEKSVYHKIKNDIRKGISRKKVYDILNKKEIKYHDDKNRNIDITGQGITIEINNSGNVHKFIPY